MSAPAMSAPGALQGRTFLHPALDYLLIGGGLSVVWFAVLALVPAFRQAADLYMLTLLIFIANCVHFSSSTVRLYTIRDAARIWPFLTLAFPLVTFGVVAACAFAPGQLGLQFQRLYLTWSPYHFAAQAYGLAVMYSYRSGCLLSAGDKRLLHAVCLLPFAYAFVGGEGLGLDWLLPEEVALLPALEATRSTTTALLRLLIFVAPLLLFVKVWRSPSGPMPLISLLAVLTNGLWWTLLDVLDAFLWATVFHGIQYLTIVMVFHVRERTAEADNRHSGLYHAVWFYAVSLALAYAIFQLLPLSYVAVGFGRVESVVLVIAAINIHHFIVDGYIWKLSRGGGNRRVVDEAPQAHLTSHSPR